MAKYFCLTCTAGCTLEIDALHPPTPQNCPLDGIATTWFRVPYPAAPPDPEEQKDISVEAKPAGGEEEQP